MNPNSAPRRDLPADIFAELVRDWSEQIAEPADPKSQPRLNLGPRYAQLAQVLQSAIEHGRIPPGSRLPPERTMAKAIGVSRGTVVSAYDFLRQLGLVVGRRGSGTWVRDDLERSPSGAGAGVSRGDKTVVSFSMANLPALQPVIDAVLSLAADDIRRPFEGHGYHTFGLPDLREAIAEYYTQRGLPTSIDQLLVTTGAQQAIYLVAQRFLTAGQSVLVEDPTYSGAIGAFRQARSGIIALPLTDEGIDPDAFQASVSSAPPRLAYLMPVHNPTGTVMSADVSTRISELASAAGTLVVEDRTLSQITFDGACPDPLATRLPAQQSITIESLSKLFWGGLRVGWVRAPAGVIDQLAELKSIADLACPVLSQVVAARLLRRIDVVRPVVTGHVVDRLEHATRLLDELLPAWEWTPPGGGLSLWLRLPVGTGTGFARHAARYDVIAAPGSAMSAGDRFGDRVRLTFALQASDLEEGMRRLARAWRSYQSVAEERPSFSVVV
jgi:DNA-binding transcriptional MocR family regulator